MNTIDMSRRSILTDESLQLGPYPLEKLKRVDELTFDPGDDFPWLRDPDVDPIDRSQALLKDEDQLGPYPLEKLKKVDKITSEIISESPPAHEKDMAFAKARWGGFGDVVKKNMEDFTVRVPIGASFFHYQKYINAYPEDQIAPEKAPLPEDPLVVTRHMKKMTYFCGAEQVGVCEVPDDVYYTNKVDGTPVEHHYKYAIVFLVRTHLPTLQSSYGNEWLDDTIAFQAYQRLTGIANTMADYIRRLGYPARSNSFNNYLTITPRLIALAGLGEFSRAGIVVNPFVGLAYKAASILTDLPLIPDKPIDFGVQHYCDSVCKICAEQCPMHALPMGEQVEYRGYKLWRIDETRCISGAAGNKHGCTCGRCAKICPYTRPDCSPEWFEGWDGNLSYIYKSVEARRKYLEEHNFVDSPEEYDKWWLPHVVQDGKIVYGKDFDYSNLDRRMQQLKKDL